MSSISSFFASATSSSFALARQLSSNNTVTPATTNEAPRVVDDGSSRQERDREQAQRPNRIGGLRPSLGPGLGLGSFRSLLPDVQGRRPPGLGLGLGRPAAPQQRPSSAPTGEASEGKGNSIDERLKDIDPKLAQSLQSLRELLAKVDPEAAKQMDELVGKILDHIDGLGSGASAGGAPVAGGAEGAAFRFERIEIALETSVTDLQIQAADGTTITAQIVKTSFSVSFEQMLGKSDPLVLDLNGNGVFDTTSAQDGSLFDITGDGLLEQAATVANGDGFLALDRNGNGSIDNGLELFGDQSGAANGFEELRKYDGNFDGRIDLRDTIFPQLQVYNDINRNGQTDIGELKSLRELQIAALLIDSKTINEQTAGGEAILESSFIRNDGSSQRLGDLLMNYLA